MGNVRKIKNPPDRENSLPRDFLRLNQKLKRGFHWNIGLPIVKLLQPFFGFIGRNQG